MKRTNAVSGFEQRIISCAQANFLLSARANVCGRFLPGEDYEIRLLGADDAATLLFVTHCASDEQARVVAVRMCTDEFLGFQIWRGHVCIETYSAAPVIS
jgi:hypothetical protein